MEDTYQYHADLLAGTLAAAEGLRGGDGTADNNLNINAVVQAPVNDARMLRRCEDLKCIYYWQWFSFRVRFLWLWRWIQCWLRFCRVPIQQQQQLEEIHTECLICSNSYEFSGGEDENDGDSSGSEDDASSTSSDGSGDFFDH